MNFDLKFLTTRVFSLLVLSAMIMISCGDDEIGVDGDLKVNFKAVYDGEPVVLLDEYTYPDGRKINFTRLSFYLSSMQLIADNGPTELDDIAYVNMSSNLGNKTDSEAGTNYTISGLTEGDYSRFGFSFGLPATINATTPADYPADSPLAKTAEYWGGWQSYIFVKVEGNADLDNNGTLDNLEGISLHIGSDETYRPILVDKALKINDDNTEEISLTIDLKDLFIQDGEVYDIVETPQIHSLSQTVKAIQLSQNLGKSLTLN